MKTESILIAISRGTPVYLQPGVALAGIAWAAAQPRVAVRAHLDDLSPVSLQPGALTVDGGVAVE